MLRGKCAYLPVRVIGRYKPCRRILASPNDFFWEEKIGRLKGIGLIVSKRCTTDAFSTLNLPFSTDCPQPSRLAPAAASVVEGNTRVRASLGIANPPHLQRELTKTRMPFMSTVAEIEAAITQLPVKDAEELREWLEQWLEDQMEMTPEFEASIERGKADLSAGRSRTVRP